MMDSSMIGKVEKAHRYAQEKERFEFLTFSVIVKGCLLYTSDAADE